MRVIDELPEDSYRPSRVYRTAQHISLWSFQSRGAHVNGSSSGLLMGVGITYFIGEK